MKIHLRYEYRTAFCGPIAKRHSIAPDLGLVQCATCRVMLDRVLEQCPGAVEFFGSFVYFKAPTNWSREPLGGHYPGPPHPNTLPRDGAKFPYGLHSGQLTVIDEAGEYPSPRHEEWLVERYAAWFECRAGGCNRAAQRAGLCWGHWKQARRAEANKGT